MSCSFGHVRLWWEDCSWWGSGCSPDTESTGAIFSDFQPPELEGIFLLFLALWYFVIVGLPRCLSGKESACNAGDLGLIPGFGRFPEEGHGSTCSWTGEPGGLQSVGLQRVNDLAGKQQFCYCSLNRLRQMVTALFTYLGLYYKCDHYSTCASTWNGLGSLVLHNLSLTSLPNFLQLSFHTRDLFLVPCPFAMFPSLHTFAQMVRSVWKSRLILSTTSV